MADDAVGWRQLLLFDAVCDAGGIGQAALVVGRTQPAVSLSIRKLEFRLGVALFERGFGGSELTPPGLILQRRVKRMRLQIERALAELVGGVALPSHRVSVICRHLTDAQMRGLVAIARSGSASDAARQLGVSQPAVHRAARELEHAVGVNLYRRRVHNVSANVAGIELARRFSLAFQEIRQAEEELAAGNKATTATMIVGVLPMLPPRLMARATQRLLDIYPNATVTLHEGSYETQLKALQFGGIDVIVGALRGLRDTHVTDPIVEAGLFEDPYVAAVRKDHPLAHRHHIALSELVDYDWVAPHPGMPRRAVVDAMLADLPSRPRVVVETSSLAMMTAMLLETDCITVLSRSQIGGSYQGDALQALNLSTSATKRTVGLTTRVDWLPTDMQAAFVAALHRVSEQDSF